MSKDISFGTWLRQRRRMLDLTQKALADQVGCAEITVRQMEADALKPSKGLALILLEKLNVPYEEHEAWLRFARGLSDFPDSSAVSFGSKPLTNLPATLSTFVGREKESYEVTQFLKNNRLVTLTGAGGIGKTRLSIQVAYGLLNDYPNGIWLVDLAPLSDPTLVPTTVLTTLGLIEQGARSPVSILIDFLRTKRVLLILDNCEHLIQACAQLAEISLHACPDLHILATSREALNIDGEKVYLVPSLTTPDSMQVSLEALPDYEAVQLFLERAKSALANFRLTRANAPAIAQICYHLDGIPLALELAAARVKLLPVEEIAARLYDRFRLLTGGARTALPRHQTLRAMIDWSHDLLPEEERVLFRRLSVFSGGWTLEAAEQVASGKWQVESDTSPIARDLQPENILDLLTSLFNKSLIIAEREQGKETRYRMLETIRQYANEKLWAAGEGEMMRQQHLAYFIELAEKAEPHLRAFHMVMWLDRLEIELDNMRAALEWAQESDTEAQLRLASALLWFWQIRGHRNEGIDWLERGLAIEAMERGDQFLTPSRAMIRGKALNASGPLLHMTFGVEKAATRLKESLALYQELGLAGRQGLAYALLRLGSIPGGSNRQVSLLEQSLRLFREIGDKFGTAECLMQLVDQANKDDYKRAVIFSEEQLALRRQIGDQDGIGSALVNLGELAFLQGDYQRAITLYEESLTIFRALRDKWAIGFHLSAYGDICLWQGDYERATTIYEEAIICAQNIGDRMLIALNVYSLGVIAWFRGNYAHATQLIKDGLAVFRDIGLPWLTSSSLHALGDIALAQGDEPRAAHWYETEQAFGREVSLKEVTIFALGGLGKVAWAQGEHELATKRFEEGLRMSQEAGYKHPTFHTYYGLGRVAQSQNDYAVARTYYQEMLEIERQRINYKWYWLKTYACAIAYPLNAFAVLAVVQNQMERASKLFSAAESLYPPLRFEMSAKERAEYDQALAAARAALGEEEFAAAWEDGRKMTLDEAVAYALEES
ncbi:MAG TPA: tetratricopeptide repeat protein [Anaerolineales bacterium]|nr:tetratricopeptide repeat protein [Anaerolineales bacterium]